MPTTYGGLVAHILSFINLLIPAIFGLVFVYFMWKMIDAWILHAADDGSREAGRQYAITAIIVFVLMISTWGIVAMLRSSLFG